MTVVDVEGIVLDEEEGVGVFLLQLPELGGCLVVEGNDFVAGVAIVWVGIDVAADDGFCQVAFLLLEQQHGSPENVVREEDDDEE